MENNVTSVEFISKYINGQGDASKKEQGIALYKTNACAWSDNNAFILTALSTQSILLAQKVAHP